MTFIKFSALAPEASFWNKEQIQNHMTKVKRFKQELLKESEEVNPDSKPDDLVYLAIKTARTQRITLKSFVRLKFNPKDYSLYKELVSIFYRLRLVK